MHNSYLYADDVIETMKSLTLTEGRAACKVSINAWDDLVWARGAAALALATATPLLIAEARAA